VNIRNRVRALESRADGPARDVNDMTDAELEAFLAPFCGGRVPTDEDLVELMKRGGSSGLRRGGPCSTA
jgi:transcriptional regulator of met regulon